MFYKTEESSAPQKSLYSRSIFGFCCLLGGCFGLHLIYLNKKQSFQSAFLSGVILYILINVNHWALYSLAILLNILLTLAALFNLEVIYKVTSSEFKQQDLNAAFVLCLATFFVIFFLIHLVLSNLFDNSLFVNVCAYLLSCICSIPLVKVLPDRQQDSIS